MSFNIIIAHYNENLEWTKNLPPDNVIIYSKGNKPDVQFKIITLPNVGQEAHTYLTYIIDNYDSLPDIIFFQQGSDDHIKADKLIDCINILIYNPRFNYVTNYLRTVTVNNMFLDNNYHIRHWNNHTLEPCKDNYIEWFKQNINADIDFNNPLIVNFGACFAVRKEGIHSRPKSYYENLIKQFNVRFPEVGHFIERSWVYLFNSQHSIFCI